MATVAELLVRIGANISNFQQGMNEVERDLTGVGSNMKKVGSGMVKAGGILTAGVTVPIIGMGTAAVKASTDFNGAMANVGTLIPNNIKRVNELKTSVQEMAVETGKSTDDLSGGLYNVISAFGDTGDTVKILQTNAKAAAAGLATTTDAINLTSSVTKGYGDTSANAVQKVSDLAFQTVKLGQTTFPELAGSIGKVTPLASTLGVSMEEMFGVMATGTGVTGSASEVSTQLRGIFQSLMSPTKDMTDLLSNLGYASGDAMIAELGLQGSINKIVESAKASDTPLQKYIGSIEGQTLALSLAGSLSDTFTEKLGAMGNVVGATDQAFKDQTQGVNANGFAMAQLRQKVAVAAQSLGDSLAPALSSVLDKLPPIIDKISSAVEWFTNLDQKSKNVVMVLIGMAAALGPLLVIIGTAISLMGSLASAATFLGYTSMLPLIGIIGAVIAAIVALIAIGILLYKNWDKIKETAIKVWGSIINFFTVTVPAKLQVLVNWFKALPTKILSYIKTLPEKMGYQLGLMVRNAIQFGINMYNGIVRFFNKLPSYISNIFSRLLSIAVNKFNQIKSKVVNIGSNLVSGLSRTVSSAPSIFSNMASRIISYVSSLPSRLYSKAVSVAKSFWNGFKKGLGIGSPSLVERAFMAIGVQGMDTLNELKKLAPKIRSEMFNITKPLPITMGGSVTQRSIPSDLISNGISGIDTQNDENVGSGLVININGMTVREEADIERIAQLLYRLQQRKTRSIGGEVSV